MTWESNATNKLIDQALAGFQDPDITVKRIDTPNGNYSDKLSALTQAKRLPARPSPTTSTTRPRSPSTPRTPKASASSWRGSRVAP